MSPSLPRLGFFISPFQTDRTIRHSGRTP
jgi:hypothetical protein